MLKGFHLAPSLRIITHTQATINRKEKTLSAKTRFSQIQAFGSRTIKVDKWQSIQIYVYAGLSVLMIRPHTPHHFITLTS